MGPGTNLMQILHIEHVCYIMRDNISMDRQNTLKRDNAYNMKHILREKSLAIYFDDSQFRRNRTLNFIVSKIYVDKRSRVR